MTVKSWLQSVLGTYCHLMRLKSLLQETICYLIHLGPHHNYAQGYHAAPFLNSKNTVKFVTVIESISSYITWVRFPSTYLFVTNQHTEYKKIWQFVYLYICYYHSKSCTHPWWKSFIFCSTNTEIFRKGICTKASESTKTSASSGWRSK